MKKERDFSGPGHIGRCGFYCGCCPNYTSGECEGCVPAHQSGDCFTRDCVGQKGMEFCPQCPDFPCGELLRREHATVLDREWLSWMGRRKEEIYGSGLLPL